jgi:hypothetical protein
VANGTSAVGLRWIALRSWDFSSSCGFSAPRQRCSKWSIHQSGRNNDILLFPRILLAGVADFIYRLIGPLVLRIQADADSPNKKLLKYPDKPEPATRVRALEYLQLARTYWRSKFGPRDS